MDGFGSHTYQWINAAGERFWVKYHFTTQQGIRNLTADEAAQLAGSDADHHIRDLYEAIEARRLPAWTLLGPGHAVRRRRGRTASTRSTSPRCGRTPTTR